jgi:NAD-dependent dihydropyrimidine dehydrogenase PreA subunit
MPIEAIQTDPDPIPKEAPMSKWLPIIDPEGCTSCVACVDACNPGSLEMRDGVAVLRDPDTCASDEHCVEACPTQTITMGWIAADGDAAVGRWQPSAGQPNC